MNALCALFHFCEMHGPRTVFCTQAFHAKTAFSSSSSSSSHSSHSSPSSPSSPTPSGPSTLPNSHGSSSSYIPHATAGTSPRDIDGPKSQGRIPTAPLSCPGCTAQIPFITITNPDGSEWIQEAKGLYTRDDEDEKVHYFGSRDPSDPQLYAAVRNACVRSLSIEFCPGRDGPVLFGDDKNGYVLSYMFKLRDSQARGESRFYSFIMLMTDRVYLISCWPFLVRAFRSMAINLQERAEVVFQKEKEAKERQAALMMSGRRTSFGPASSPEQYLRSRRGATVLRALVDLLGIKDLYVHMHGQFSWILKAAGQRRIEKVMQGRRPTSVECYQSESINHDNDKDSKDSKDKSQQPSLVPSASSSTVTSTSSIPSVTPGTAPAVVGLTTAAAGATMSMGLAAQSEIVGKSNRATPGGENVSGPRRVEDKVKVAEK